MLQIFQKLLAAFDYKVQLIKNCLEINLSMTNVCNTWEEDKEHRMKARVYIWAHSFFPLMHKSTPNSNSGIFFFLFCSQIGTLINVIIFLKYNTNQFENI